jgi:glycosyltransferase involved in cell wall biosynthesis
MICDENNDLAGQIIEMVNNKPEIAQLISAMRKYIEEPKTFKRHSQLALKAYEKFDIKNLGEKYLSLYQNAI